MSSKTILLVGAAVVALVALRRPRAAGVPYTNDLPSPQDWAAWWRARAGGTPSTLGSNGSGVVTPGTLTARMGSFFGGTEPYVAPKAGTTLLFMKPASPAGVSYSPGVTVPGQPTGVSATQPEGTITNVSLAGPVSASPWFYPISLVDPVAAWWGGGSMIDSRMLSGVR